MVRNALRAKYLDAAITTGGAPCQVPTSQRMPYNVTIITTGY
jgi:hypothetical protein